MNDKPENPYRSFAHDPRLAAESAYLLAMEPVTRAADEITRQEEYREKREKEQQWLFGKLYEALELLESDHFDIMLMRVLAEKPETCESIAKRLGRDPATLQELEKQAIERLGQWMEVYRRRYCRAFSDPKHGQARRNVYVPLWKKKDVPPWVRFIWNNNAALAPIKLVAKTGLPPRMRGRKKLLEPTR